MSKRKKATNETKSVVRTPIRFQVSALEGGEVEKEFLDLLEDVPPPLRASVNIGSLFRQVMLENDKEIAKTIRTTMQEKEVH
ncbi:hypothetical protein [Ruegeria sp. HKCCD7559]|uniref:hypothetical protein n=1 Tax=Ruegeria TaxID=97050 RepID=UPI001492C467|nr:hypothetical protein [Ruegeria sp. HKCCD7559]NOC47335.1 hypothetical protein [Ruegeria sp. HKCCD7559]